MPKITFVLEDGQEIVVPLTDRVTVGSAEDNDVLVDDERVSAHHAELLLNADGSVQLLVLKSANGSIVNGVRVLSHTL
ncbi:MAG: FHA domain-containing protein, partial [Verrucomicrobiaceae bacterium]|nr:FHA domain-containing protein [Verrucomicrobiaceae bacterium]